MGPRVLALCAVVFACLSASAQAFDAGGSARQVWATGLAPGSSATLTNAEGKTVATKKVDALGATLFRDVAAGSGYHVAAGGEQSAPLTVLTNASAPPSTAVYDQTIPSSGYGYVKMRDGIELAYSVHPPANATGPTPTLLEYAGYGYADPKSPQNGIAQIANLMGFTVVDVNMRGTGCSGGAFDYFEPLQSLDGYDVIETIARQPWVKDHHVGMFGISYGGISQLFTAATRPPSLAAIAPLSVIDSTQTTLYPGGVLNTGFALSWAKERVDDAKPSDANHGEQYAREQIAAGDATCKANQALHSEAVDLIDKTRANEHYVPGVADPLAPETFVDKIDVPVFMACQFTDEQTGGHCPTLARRFTGTSKRWFTFTNGTHIDSLDPATFTRMIDFLSLYVAGVAPSGPAAAIRPLAPVVYKTATGIDGLTLPEDPIQKQPDFASALAAFEKLPRVRVLFDNGAGGKKPGEPYPAFERSFPSLPAPRTSARPWYLDAKGSLGTASPKRAQGARFTWNPKARALNDFHGDTASGKDGLWSTTPPYAWKQPPAGSAASFVSSALGSDVTVLGAGAVTAWVKTTARSVDLQATVSEVRPDGKESFVQSGWLRADERKLDAKKSTALEPVLSLRASDVEALPKGRWAKVTIPLYYQGHAYRKGSRLRLTISAPNGDQPIWGFSETAPAKSTQVTLGAGGSMRSKLLLPVVAGVKPTAKRPPCPGLRGEPCRSYAPTRNRVVGASG